MRVFSVGLISLLLPQTAMAQAPAELSAMEIVEKANHAIFYQGGDQKARVGMLITDKQGRKRTRQLTLLRRNFGAGDTDQKYYVYFNKPSDVKKLVFMAWKNTGADDDRWLYLPALDLVKRIAASDERTSFVGSDFFYQDVSGREINEDVHRLVGEDNEFYIIESTPKDPKDVEFFSYKNWVDKTTFLPKRAEYLNDKGIVYRVYKALNHYRLMSVGLGA